MLPKIGLPRERVLQSNALSDRAARGSALRSALAGPEPFSVHASLLRVFYSKAIYRFIENSPPAVLN